MKRYTVYARYGSDGQWRHMGYRDTETQAINYMKTFLEDGAAAFYAPIKVNVIDPVPDWPGVEVDPNA